MKKSTRPRLLGILFVQAIVGGAFAAAWARMPADAVVKLEELVSDQPVYQPPVIDREEPLRVAPLYDDSQVVSDEELAAVLKQVQPRFSHEKLKPNHVEHALRAWHVDAVFQDKRVLSGEFMRNFLVDYGAFMLSWEADTTPLLVGRPTGIYVRWGREDGSSVHHDHTLACLTEAGVPLSQPVRAPGYPNRTMRDMINQAIYDFDLDERETEWSAMAFSFWIAPTREWENGRHRRINFDMIAERQMRGHKEYGVCGGTHRVYSLMALWRIDQEHSILSDETRKEVYEYLKSVRDILLVTQHEDGHWPYNWPDGADALVHPEDYPAYRDVISTGHHLEWLAIAPEELHPPREMIYKAADWIINNTTSKTPEEILDNYTFYSHVGNALALWRKTRPAAFWKEWEAAHPFDPTAEESEAVAPDAEPSDTQELRPAESEAAEADSGASPETVSDSPAGDAR